MNFCQIKSLKDVDAGYLAIATTVIAATSSNNASFLGADVLERTACNACVGRT